MTDNEKYQLENAIIEKNEVYEIMRNMVLHNTKPMVRHKKPAPPRIEDTLNYLYSMKIYRDWVTKQRSEEGIARQMALDEKAIESEERMVRGTRCSLRLNPMIHEYEMENEASKGDNSRGVTEDNYEKINNTDINEASSKQKELLYNLETCNTTSKQQMPKCVQQFQVGILNINVLTVEKLEKILIMYVKEDYDIIALVDTRVTKREENAFTTIIRKYQRRGDYHKYFDIKENQTNPGSKKVGGMLFLMYSRCGVMVNLSLIHISEPTRPY